MKLVSLLAILVSAATLLALTLPAGEKIFSPGRLSASHSGIGNNQCADCHLAVLAKPEHWLADAFSEQDAAVANGKCLTCHKLGPQADLPHGVLAATLNIGVGSAVMGQPNKVSCVNCHQEHRGLGAELTEVSNRQCDDCHSVENDPFATRHAAFSGDDTDLARQLLFSHRKHFDKHFHQNENNRPAKLGQCSNCHQLSGKGDAMKLKIFSESCGSCHNRDVTGDKLERKGLAFVALPSLDIDTLANQGVAIGRWPKDIDGTEITAFTYLLLAGNTELSPLLTKLKDGDIDLGDLSEASQQDLALVGKLVWHLKSMVGYWATKGQQGLTTSIEAALLQNLSHEEMRNMLGGFPVDLLKAGLNAWLPSLTAELAAYRQGIVPTTRGVDSEGIQGSLGPTAEQMVSGGWYLQDHMLLYRASGHADPFFQQWLQATAPDGVETGEAIAPETVDSRAIVHQALSARGASGQCGKCHARQLGANRQLHWTSLDQKLATQGFTRFNHAAHLKLSAEQQCHNCHQQAADPSHQMDFAPTDKAMCATCHVDGLAGDNCISCHTYHGVSPTGIVIRGPRDE